MQGYPSLAKGVGLRILWLVLREFKSLPLHSIFLLILYVQASPPKQLPHRLHTCCSQCACVYLCSVVYGLLRTRVLPIIIDTLKLIRGWAGLYAVNTLDSNAILGNWPEIRGLYLANGFSGHGLQQAPAVGRYLSELITGKSPVLDLSAFHPDRILENRPLSEGGLV